MRAETKPWLQKAEENLDTAEYMFQKEFLIRLSRHYYQVRYPDMAKLKYNKEIAQETLNKTRELFLWIRKQINTRSKK